MTQGKHTPGPWVQSGDACIVGQDRKDVAYLTRNTMPNPELRANARLIAAAPDMLEACQIISDCANSAKGMTAAQVRIALDMAANTARAAIAKATGEKP